MDAAGGDRVYARGSNSSDRDHLSPVGLGSRDAGDPRNMSTSASSTDSSLLVMIRFQESTFLVGRPALALSNSRVAGVNNGAFAVVQVVSNSLFMFQSIENADGSGVKTLHMSVDDLSSIVNNEFEPVSPKEVPPMIGPCGVECRVVYTTENLGCVVAQNVSLNSEAIKSCFTPNDLSTFLNVGMKMYERLRSFGINETTETVPMDRHQGPLHMLVRYQKKGTGIATSLRVEVQEFSFMLLRAFKSVVGAPQFLDLRVDALKGNFEGCLSAMSGDVNGFTYLNFFNPEVNGWEYAVERFPLALLVEQMPNELVRYLCSKYTLMIISSRAADVEACAWISNAS